MRRLTLLRHANAAAKAPDGDDFDRPLTQSGLAEAETLARRLLRRDAKPDLLIASAARRTTQTAHALARELALDARAIAFDDRLYLADAAEILLVARSAPTQAFHLMIVGHNPGISELGALLAPHAGLAEFATASGCTMIFEVATWSSVAPGAAHQVHREPPLEQEPGVRD